MVSVVGGSIFLVSSDITLGHSWISLRTVLSLNFPLWLDVRTRSDREADGGKTRPLALVLLPLPLAASAASTLPGGATTVLLKITSISYGWQTRTEQLFAQLLPTKITDRERFRKYCARARVREHESKENKATCVSWMLCSERERERRETMVCFCRFCCGLVLLFMIRKIYWKQRFISNGIQPNVS